MHGSSKGWSAPTALALVLALAACGGRDTGPAPVFQGGAEVRGPVPAPPPAPPPGTGPTHIMVERGQSLSMIAHLYHVPQRLLIEVNHLKPPYKVEAGHILEIPAGAGPESGRVAVAALPPPRPEPPAVRPVPEPKPAPPIAAKPAPAPEHAAPAHEAAAEPPEKKPASHAGGNFLWPVRGKVLASYGSTAEGTHNDGINIAAPKGAPVEAADGGVVAYAGNELRGYGNLILIKHANGWISAYAHCDTILVKQGQKVSRGQTIAHVGATGSVSEPQLHFELRRGNHPVDPREFLEPASTAGGPKSASG